jgi:hypothetical protein
MDLDGIMTRHRLFELGLGLLRRMSEAVKFLARVVTLHPLLVAVAGGLTALLAWCVRSHNELVIVVRNHQRVLHVLLNAWPDLTSALLALAGLSYLMPDLALKLQRRKLLRCFLMSFLVLFAIFATVLNAIHRKEQDHMQETQSKKEDAERASITGIEHDLSPQVAKLTEPARREHLMAALRDEYIATHDQVNPEVVAGTRMPPDDWLDQRLRQLGERWSVVTASRSTGQIKTPSSPELLALKADEQLLQQAKSWQNQLCGFEKSWWAEQMGRETSVRAKDVRFNMSRQSTDKELRFWTETLEVDRRVVYLRDYAERSNQLRMQLIGKVPGAEDPDTDYLSFPPFTAENGKPLMTLVRMEDICRDFSSLVEAYETMLHRK